MLSANWNQGQTRLRRRMSITNASRLPCFLALLVVVGLPLFSCSPAQVVYFSIHEPVAASHAKVDTRGHEARGPLQPPRPQGYLPGDLPAEIKPSKFFPAVHVSEAAFGNTGVREDSDSHGRSSFEPSRIQEKKWSSNRTHALLTFLSQGFFPSASCQPGFGIDGTGQCVKCPAGSFSDGSQECRLCPKGLYSSSAGSADCSTCDQFSYTSQQGSIACSVCPSNQWTSMRASTEPLCMCLTGFYPAAYRGNGTVAEDQLAEAARYSEPQESDCISCPPGAVCPGAFARPHPQSGYYGVPSKPYEFWPCDWSTEACKGGADFECREGHTGRMCGRCIAREYYMLGGLCNKCSAEAKLIIVFLVLGLVVGGIMFGALAKIGATVTMTACVQHMQVLTVINRMGGNWPPAMQQALQVVSMINFNPNVLQLNCDKNVKHNDFLDFQIMMLIPIFALLLVCILYSAMGYKEWQKIKLMDVWKERMKFWFIKFFLIGYNMFLQLVYMPFSIRALEVLNCKTLNGVTYNPVTPDVICYDAAYNRTFLPLAIFTVVFLTLGLPVMNIAIFVHCRKGVETNIHQDTFAVFWKKYMPKWYFWQLVLILRKMGIGISVALLRDFPLFQAISSMTAWMVAMTLHFYARPYKFKTLDRLDDLLFVLMLGIFFACVLYRAQLVTTGTEQLILNAFVFSCVSLAALALFAYVLAEIYHGVIVSRLNATASEIKGTKKEMEFYNPTLLMSMAQSLSSNEILPKTIASWLTYKADDDEKALLQQWLHSFSGFLTADDHAVTARPTSLSQLPFDNNSPAQVLRFLMEASRSDKDGIRRFLQGIKDLLGKDYVLDSCEPVLLADWLLTAEEESVQRVRGVLHSMQIWFEKEQREFNQKEILKEFQKNMKKTRRGSNSRMTLGSLGSAGTPDLEPQGGMLSPHASDFDLEEPDSTEAGLTVATQAAIDTKDVLKRLRNTQMQDKAEALTPMAGKEGKSLSVAKNDQKLVKGKKDQMNKSASDTARVDDDFVTVSGSKSSIRDSKALFQTARQRLGVSLNPLVSDIPPSRPEKLSIPSLIPKLSTDIPPIDNSTPDGPVTVMGRRADANQAQEGSQKMVARQALLRARSRKGLSIAPRKVDSSQKDNKKDKLKAKLQTRKSQIQKHSSSGSLQRTSSSEVELPFRSSWNPQNPVVSPDDVALSRIVAEESVQDVKRIDDVRARVTSLLQRTQEGMAYPPPEPTDSFSSLHHAPVTSNDHGGSSPFTSITASLGTLTSNIQNIGQGDRGEYGKQAWAGSSTTRANGEQGSSPREY